MRSNIFSSLQQRLSQSNSDQAKILKDGADRLEALKLDTVKSEERRAAEERLESIRETRVVNPEAAANLFSNLLARDGGFGAAIGAGITAAQSDFASLVEGRISDAEKRLGELRQSDRDAVQDNQIAFNQTRTINDANNSAAALDTSSLEAELTRLEERDQRNITNDQNERRIDISRRNSEETARNNIASSNRADRNADRLDRQERRELRDQELNQRVTLATTREAISKLEDGSAVQDEQERSTVTAFVSEISDVGGLGFLDSIFRESANEDAKVRNRADVILARGNEIVAAIQGFQDSASVERLSSVVNDGLREFEIQIESKISDIAVNDPERAKQARELYFQQFGDIALLKAKIEDATAAGTTKQETINKANQQVEILELKLANTVQDIQEIN